LAQKQKRLPPSHEQNHLLPSKQTMTIPQKQETPLPNPIQPMPDAHTSVEEISVNHGAGNSQAGQSAMQIAQPQPQPQLQWQQRQQEEDDDDEDGGRWHKCVRFLKNKYVRWSIALVLFAIVAGVFSVLMIAVAMAAKNPEASVSSEWEAS